MSEQNDLWAVFGKMDKRQAHAETAIVGVQQRLEVLERHTLQPLPIGADGERLPQRQVIFEHEGKAHWLCGCCGQRFPLDGGTESMRGTHLQIGNEVVGTACQLCLPVLRQEVEALFPHPQVVA